MADGRWKMEDGRWAKGRARRDRVWAAGTEMFYDLFADRIRYGYSDSPLVVEVRFAEISTIRRRFHPRFRQGLWMLGGWIVWVGVFVALLPRQYATNDVIIPLVAGFGVVAWFLGKHWNVRNVLELSKGKDGLLVIVDAANRAAAEAFITAIERSVADARQTGRLAG